MDRGLVFPGVNISDRGKGSKRNYRCPDIAVFLNGNLAQDCGTHWVGGPDLAIEIVSPGDRSRRKLDFYVAVGTREVLILDRDPWKLELFRRADGELTSAGVSAAETGDELRTESVPFVWRLLSAAPRPQVELVCTDDDRRWLV